MTALRFALLLVACVFVHQANSFDLLYKAMQRQAEFNPQLSYLSLVASAAAYANGAASECYDNSGLSNKFGPITDVSQVEVPTSWKQLGGTWSGFVARMPKMKVTLVVYRGTNEDKQLIIQLLSVLRQPPVPSPVGGRVQAYFLNAQQAVWSKLAAKFQQLRSAHPDDQVLVTGHSLGGAMAALTAADLAATGRQRPQLYTFGEPRVGDAEFAAAFDKLMSGAGSWRVVNGRDPVVHLPLCKDAPERCNPLESAGPYHHGTEVFYPSGMRPDSPDGFQICRGQPKDEDAQCADSPKVVLACLTDMASCIDAHLNYYAIRVGRWWQNSLCKPAF